MSGALDPVSCTRCDRKVTADDPERPEHLDSRVFRPLNPRPSMPGGAAVTWTVEDDYQDGTVSALLCGSCLAELQNWLYARRP